MRQKSSLAILVVLTTAAWGVSAQRVVELEPAATTIRFELGATMHTVHGTAVLDHGRITYDPDTGEAGGEVVVNTSSVDTDNVKRDKKMHAKVLESDRFPTITLRPVQISGSLPSSGAATITVAADFTIHGTTHRISIPTQVTVAGDGRIDLSAEFEVPYVEWGLDDPSTFLLRVAKKINVTVESRSRAPSIVE